MTSLVTKLVPDELCEIVAPLPPPAPHSPRGGRPRSVPDRNCLAGIIYMTRASIPWELLPARELGCGSYVTCWRRFAEWADAGVFERLHLVLLDRLGEQSMVDGSGLLVDSASLRAKRGDHVGANPVDRGKPGSKLHLATDAGGTPLALLLSGANVNDSLLFEVLIDEVPPVRTPAGRRRCRPERVYADKGYDHRRCHRYLARTGDQGADRGAWRGIVEPAWAAKVAGGAVVCLAGLLPAAWGAVGSLLGPVLRLRGVGLRTGLLQDPPPVMKRALMGLPTPVGLLLVRAARAARRQAAGGLMPAGWCLRSNAGRAEQPLQQAGVARPGV